MDLQTKAWAGKEADALALRRDHVPALPACRAILPVPWRDPNLSQNVKVCDIFLRLCRAA